MSFLFAFSKMNNIDKMKILFLVLCFLGCARGRRLLYGEDTSNMIALDDSYVLPKTGFPTFFRFMPKEMTWTQARMACKGDELGEFAGRLAVPDTPEKFDGMRAYMTELGIRRKFWIGLRGIPEGPANFVWRKKRTYPLDLSHSYFAQQIDPRRAYDECYMANPRKNFLWEGANCNATDEAHQTKAEFLCEADVPEWLYDEEKGCIFDELANQDVTVTYTPALRMVQLFNECDDGSLRIVTCRRNIASKEDILKNLQCDRHETFGGKTLRSDRRIVQVERVAKFYRGPGTWDTEKDGMILSTLPKENRWTEAELEGETEEDRDRAKKKKVLKLWAKVLEDSEILLDMLTSPPFITKSSYKRKLFGPGFDLVDLIRADLSDFTSRSKSVLKIFEASRDMPMEKTDTSVVKQYYQDCKLLAMELTIVGKAKLTDLNCQKEEMKKGGAFRNARICEKGNIKDAEGKTSPRSNVTKRETKNNVKITKNSTPSAIISSEKPMETIHTEKTPTTEMRESAIGSSENTTKKFSENNIRTTEKREKELGKDHKVVKKDSDVTSQSNRNNSKNISDVSAKTSSVSGAKKYEFKNVEKIRAALVKETVESSSSAKPVTGSSAPFKASDRGTTVGLKPTKSVADLETVSKLPLTSQEPTQGPKCAPKTSPKSFPSAASLTGAKKASNHSTPTVESSPSDGDNLQESTTAREKSLKAREKSLKARYEEAKYSGVKKGPKSAAAVDKDFNTAKKGVTGTTPTTVKSAKNATPNATALPIAEGAPKDLQNLGDIAGSKGEEAKGTTVALKDFNSSTTTIPEMAKIQKEEKILSGIGHEKFGGRRKRRIIRKENHSIYARYLGFA